MQRLKVAAPEIVVTSLCNVMAVVSSIIAALVSVTEAQRVTVDGFKKVS